MLSRADERLIHALHRRKIREGQGFFLAEGIRVGEELARSAFDLNFAVVSASLEDNDRGRGLLALLKPRCPVHIVPDAELKRHAATEQPQGVLIVAAVPQVGLNDVDLPARATLLVADAVQDPGNLGTLIRIADAFAASAVIALPGTVDPWNAKAVRASAGSAFHLPVLTTDAEAFSQWCSEHSLQVLGAEAGGVSVDEIELKERVALIVGNEGAGLTEGTHAMVDQTIGIRMPGRSESLNVGVAAGILMYLVSNR